MERLSYEFDAVGFYLSGHPLDSYEKVLQKLGVKRYAEFEAMAERGACEGRLAGIVIAARERQARSAATSSPSACSPTPPGSSRR